MISYSVVKACTPFPDFFTGKKARLFPVLHLHLLLWHPLSTEDNPETDALQDLDCVAAEIDIRSPLVRRVRCCSRTVREWPSFESPKARAFPEMLLR